MRTHDTETEKWEAYYAALALVEPDEATRLFNTTLTAAIRELLPNGGRILEAGCGGGWQSLALAEEGGFEVALLDFSQAALQYAERVFESRGRNATFILGDAFDCGAEEYDLVFNAGVLEHYSVSDQTRMVKAMASRSRNYVLPLVPNRGCYWYWLWRGRLGAELAWEWGKEVPLSDLSEIIDNAGLECLGHGYFGESWTRHFIKTVMGKELELAGEILKIHDSPVIPLSQRAYLVGSLGAKQRGPVPERWMSSKLSADQNAALQAALSDALALRLAGERRLAEAQRETDRLREESDRLRVEMNQPTAEAKAEADRVQGELRSAVEKIEARLLDELRVQSDRAASQVSEFTAKAGRLTGALDEAQRETKRLQESARQDAEELRARLAESNAFAAESQREAAALRVSLQAKEKENAQGAEALRAAQNLLRAALDKNERLRIAGVTAFARYADRLSDSLATYRSQRAWTVMVGIREMYARWARGGNGGKWKALSLPLRGLIGSYVADEEFSPAFPDPLHDLPAVFEQPLTEAALEPPRRQFACDLVFLPIFDFEFRHQRPQQVAVALSRNHHRIFWISPSRSCTTGEGTYEAVQLRSNLWEVRIPGGPFDLYGGTLTDSMVAAIMPSLERLFADFAVSEYAVLVQFPYWRRLALEMRRCFPSRLAYDLMDDWRNWATEPLISTSALNEEEEFVRECDVLFVTAWEFMKRHADNEPRPLLVPNGADFDFFHNANQSAKRLQEYSKPIIGYYGAISTWFDLELMENVARARPDYTFMLIGGVHKVDVSKLKALPNVKLTGEKNYRELPAYLAAFDVCLIPFRINTLTKAVDPVKFYEYLSQAKPIVSTPMFELMPHKELLYLAHGASEFAAAIDSALGEAKTDSGMRERRLTFARENSWTERARQIDQAVGHSFPLVSILVVTYNSAEFIRPFAESLIAETTYPHFEVICVDNGSTDDTMARLTAFAQADPRFHVERAPKNLGFAGGNNLAARRSSGDYIVFLNPDTILTRGWLGRLIAPLWRDSKVGMTAPVTNFSGNQTKVDFTYRNLAGLRAFAEERARKYWGQIMDIPVAPLLCGVISRSLWERVGALDESFEVGMFEDDDFAVRVKKAGYRIVTAEDCFIHHFGNGSFSQLGGEENHRIFEENRRLFEKKWGAKWNPHQHREGVRSLAKERRLSVDEMLEAPGDGSVDEAIIDLRILCLHPATTVAGAPINPQSDGSSALAVTCENATPDTTIEFDGVPLSTFYGTASSLSATVPSDLLDRVRTAEVRLVNELGRSAPVSFTIVPSAE